MSKRDLKIKFTDFWYGFDPNNNLILQYLNEHFNTVVSDKPDVLIYSGFGKVHLAYTCPKIFYTGENERPDFNECDYAVTFDYDDYNGRHFRFPLYRWQVNLEKLCEEKDADEIILQKTKFCCMLISNPNGRERNEFFRKLSQYKKVDSGGSFENNIGYRVKDKNDFIKDYKFVFAFENSSYPGYTTEKIAEPMFVNSLAVYWGNPLVDREFNERSFINIHRYASFDEAISDIIKIDNDPELYKSYISQPYFTGNVVPDNLKHSYFSGKWAEAVKLVLTEKPVNRGIRRIINYTNAYFRIFMTKLNHRFSSFRKRTHAAG